MSNSNWIEAATLFLAGFAIGYFLWKTASDKK
jgi:hypothetical protein